MSIVNGEHNGVHCTRVQTTTNLYIIALAVSDLMSAKFVMPFALGVLITGEWVYGPVICHFHAFFVHFVMYAQPSLWV